MPMSLRRGLHMTSDAKTQPLTRMTAAAERYDAAAERYDAAIKRVQRRLAPLRRDGIESSTITAVEREEYIAAIDAAVASERARCAAVARSMAGVFPMGCRLAEAIERGDKP